MGPFNGLFKPDVEKLDKGHDTNGLIKALQHKDDAVRTAAAKALGNYKDVACVNALISALEDRETWVRVQAANSLAKIGNSDAIEPLAAALQGSGKDGRMYLAIALGKLGDQRAVEYLVELLTGKDRWAIENALSLLVKFRDQRSEQPLIALVNRLEKEAADKRVQNDKNYIQGLDKAKTGSTPGIVNFLSDSLAGHVGSQLDTEMINNALAALEQIGTVEAKQFVEDYRLRKQ